MGEVGEKEIERERERERSISTVFPGTAVLPAGLAAPPFEEGLA